MATSAPGIPRNAAPRGVGPVVVVRHSHMDQEWIATFGRSLSRAQTVLEGVVERLEADPGERFVLDGIPPLAAVLRGDTAARAMEYSSAYHRLYVAALDLGHGKPRRPADPAALHERMRACVARGQLEFVGTFVQPDTNLPAGEALVRQALAARAWYRAHLGTSPTVAWNLDSFGQSAQLPQILTHCGYRALLAFRLGPTEDPGISNAPTGLADSFIFRGPDGTELLTHALPLGYSPGVVRVPRPLAWLAVVTRIPRAASELAHTAGPRPVLVPFGSEFAPPLPAVHVLLRRLRAKLPGREVRLGTASDFFDALRRFADQLPTHEGDLNPVFPGTHALRPAIKRADRELTGEVQAAETLDALLSARGRPDGARRAALGAAWGALLTNQAHDSIGGCHTPAVNADVMTRYRTGGGVARDAMAMGLERLGADALSGRGAPPEPTATAGRDRPLVVFNALPWERTDEVAIPWSGPPPTSIRDGRGRNLPFVERDAGGLGQLVVRATVPALGYHVLRARPGGKGPGSGRRTTPGLDGESAESAPFPRGEWRAGPTSLRPLPGGRLALDADGEHVATVHPPVLEEDRGNAYLARIGATLARSEGGAWRTERDPVGETASCDCVLGGEPLRILVRRVPGRPWFGLAVAGTAVPDGSRVRLPVRGPGCRRAVVEVPFGEVTRRGQVAAQGYVRLGGSAGLANLGVPAHEVGPASVDLILLRSVRLLSQRWPLRRLRIDIDATVRRPWRTDLALAADARVAARELAQPLRGWVAPWPWPARRRGRLGLRGSLLAPPVGPHTVEIVAIKPPESGEGCVLRLVQMANEAAEVVVAVPGPGRTWRTDGEERPQEGLAMHDGLVHLRLGPWGIATVLWRPELP